MLRKLFAFQGALFFPSFPALCDGTCNHKDTLRHVLPQGTHQRIAYARSFTSIQSSLVQSRPFYISATTSSGSEVLPKEKSRTDSLLVVFDDVSLQDVGSQKGYFLSLLSAFTNPQYRCYGLHAHCCIMQFWLEPDVVLATALVNMYSKCGSLEDARRVFDSASHRDVVLWTSIITAYAKQGLVTDAVGFFDSMLQAKVTPDALSFVSILNACGSFPSIDINPLCGRIVSAGLDMDVGIGTALLNLHVSRGDITEAMEAFHKLPKCNKITWNSMISLYAHLGHSTEALQLYSDMLQEGLIPDSITFVAILQAFFCKASLPQVRQLHVHILAAQLSSNMMLLTTLMNAYGKCKSAEGALGTWSCITSKNVVVWSAYIAVLTQLQLGQEAVGCSSRMLEEGILPNEVTYTSVLEACTLQRMLSKGKQIHASSDMNGAFQNVHLLTALLNLYNNCSDLVEVRKLFDIAKQRDVVLWTTAISAHTFRNYERIAAQLFYQMQQEGVLPNVVTHISVLDACSTLPCLALGKQAHARIGSRDVTSEVDVGTSLINMYAKCGCLARACSVFDTMTVKDRSSWTTIVSAYAHNGEEKEALGAFGSMIRQGLVRDSVTFLSIMALCSHSGLIDLGISMLVGMKNDFGLEPLASHYDCVIDALGRAGQLNVAEQLLNHMPVEPSEISWTSVLGACRNNIDIHWGELLNHMPLVTGEMTTPPGTSTTRSDQGAGRFRNWPKFCFARDYLASNQEHWTLA